MPNTLKIVQTISKIGKIISAIVTFICLILVLLCVIGIIIVKHSELEFFGLHCNYIFSLFKTESIFKVYAILIIGIVLSSARASLAGFSFAFFSNEVKTGHPFTTKLSSQLLFLGSLEIIIPVVSAFISMGIQLFFEHICGESFFFHFNYFGYISLGMFYILTANICKLGAEELFINHNEDIFSKENY